MRALLCLSLAACGFPRATAALECQITADCDDGRVCIDGFCVVDDNGGADGPGPDSARFDCTQWPATQHFAPCDIVQPTGALTLDQPIVYTLDTGTGELVPAGGTAIPVATAMIASGRLISVDALTINTGATLRVIGPVPLIVAAWTTIEIAGDIEAGSTQLEAGAGANPTTECGLRLATNGTLDNDGGGGAGGGGFQGTGGTGGRGDLDAATGGPGGGPALTPPLLLGGCNGAKGGDGDLPGGIGGFGGGAFQLTAKDTITIDGKLNAGGAGGEPGGATDDGGGGGGGGSGGMIGFEATNITVGAAAIVAANGGGGGEGGRSPGERGQDATAVATRAQGGNNGTAGDGGLGSGQGVINGGGGQNDQNGGGGGGGGGAAGFITVKGATTLTGTVTPAPTTIP
jgi:hypothetical protein